MYIQRYLLHVMTTHTIFKFYIAEYDESDSQVIMNDLSPGDQ